jgi:hypothetical protein
VVVVDIEDAELEMKRIKARVWNYRKIMNMKVNKDSGRSI